MNFRLLATTLCVMAGLAIGKPAQAASGAKKAKQATEATAEKQPKQAAPVVSPAGPEDLKNLLVQMNNSARTFKTAQADFEWDQYQSVVQETDVQKGQMYLLRTGKGMDAALRITAPVPKQVVFKDGKLSFFEPKINQVTERTAGSNRADVEAFMSLGFGASGDDLQKSYDVKMEGWETVSGVKTARLELTPKAAKLKSSLSKIVLWIDPARSLALQQKFLEPSGDYRLARYSNIKVNGKLPGDAFKLKTTSRTTFVHPE